MMLLYCISTPGLIQWETELILYNVNCHLNLISNGVPTGSQQFDPLVLRGLADSPYLKTSNNCILNFGTFGTRYKPPFATSKLKDFECSETA